MNPNDDFRKRLADAAEAIIDWLDRTDGDPDLEDYDAEREFDLSDYEPEEGI